MSIVLQTTHSSSKCTTIITPTVFFTLCLWDLFLWVMWTCLSGFFSNMRFGWNRMWMIKAHWLIYTELMPPLAHCTSVTVTQHSESRVWCFSQERSPCGRSTCLSDGKDVSSELKPKIWWSILNQDLNWSFCLCLADFSLVGQFLKCVIFGATSPNLPDPLPNGIVKRISFF